MLTLAAWDAPEVCLLNGDGKASVPTILPAKTFLFGPLAVSSRAGVLYACSVGWAIWNKGFRSQK